MNLGIKIVFGLCFLLGAVVGARAETFADQNYAGVAFQAAQDSMASRCSATKIVLIYKYRTRRVGEDLYIDSPTYAIRCTPKPTTKKITLSWNPVTTREDGSAVKINRYYLTHNGKEQALGDVLQTTTTAEVGDTFTVKAMDSNGLLSKPSNTVKVP